MAAQLGFSQDKSDNSLHYKNQNQSNIIFGEVSPKEFLSFNKWKIESDVKDQSPEWEQALRARRNHEGIGRFLQCVGTCHIERGDGFFNPQFRSPLYETDEIQTIGDSYAWIFLLDGTMIRLSPESSITLNEINLSSKENFINARLNLGNVLWMSRLENLFKENNSTETDRLFMPIGFYEATPVIDTKIRYVEGDLMLLLDDPRTTIHQIQRLNKLIAENDELTNGKKTFVVLTLPNITLLGNSPTIEAVTLMGGKSYIRKRSFDDLDMTIEPEDKEEELQYQLRGYDNKELNTLNSSTWMEVDEKGKSISNVDEISLLSLLNVGGFITKRIPTILVARELLIKSSSELIFQENYDRANLAKNYGYRLWTEKELELRLDFIKEYFRRIETTNLLSSAHFVDRMKARGQPVPSVEFSSVYFKTALEKLNSYDPNVHEIERGEPLNSTSKYLWKVMNGIK
jgi:hypothetical protein